MALRAIKQVIFDVSGRHKLAVLCSLMLLTACEGVNATHFLQQTRSPDTASQDADEHAERPPVFESSEKIDTYLAASGRKCQRRRLDEQSERIIHICRFPDDNEWRILELSTRHDDAFVQEKKTAKDE